MIRITSYNVCYTKLLRGLVPGDIEFLKQCRELCTKNGALLIFDEVMSGFRASLTGAHGVVDIKADIITFGKVIGAGMPVGAFASSKEIIRITSYNVCYTKLLR